MTFELCRLRFHFRASQSLVFAPGQAGNVLRGALGLTLLKSPDADAYRAVFAPKALGAGPSGLADRPRPFVVRAAHLDGATIAAGMEFNFDLHLFDTGDSVRVSVMEAIERMAGKGFGATRARAALVTVEQDVVLVDLNPAPESVQQLRVQFVTPTELKAGQKVVTRPEFAVLFARLRDRVSTLRALYGAGPLEIDFQAMAGRASCVRLTHCDLRWTQTERRSSRTGQTHPLGGFTGDAIYEGDLGEFLPYLRAAVWTGVGRQTVWGKGEIRFQRV